MLRIGKCVRSSPEDQSSLDAGLHLFSQMLHVGLRKQTGSYGTKPVRPTSAGWPFRHQRAPHSPRLTGGFLFCLVTTATGHLLHYSFFLMILLVKKKIVHLSSLSITFCDLHPTAMQHGGFNKWKIITILLFIIINNLVYNVMHRFLNFCIT